MTSTYRPSAARPSDLRPKPRASDALTSAVAPLAAKLAAVLADRPPYHRDVDAAVVEFRDAAQQLMLKDLAAAHRADMDEVLWISAHYVVIDAYRKVLAKMRPQAKTRPTEARKLNEFFVKFIKSSMHFYRTHLQCLVSHFCITDLEPVVKRLHLEVIKSPRASKAADQNTRQLVLKSCHRTLVCLGDLSRYRETHALAGGEKDWRPASNYYSLAKQVLPSAGAPHNQLAVMAMVDGSVLSSAYHFFRAICVAQPYPTAEKNLNLLFKKFLKNSAVSKENGCLRRDEIANRDLLEPFLTWTARAVSLDGPGPDGLEETVIAQLSAAVADSRVTIDILTKIVLINISALDVVSRDRARQKLAPHIAWFNVATFSSLLRCLNDELEPLRSEQPPRDFQADGFSTASRRVMYGLRVYSAWLRIHAQDLMTTGVAQNERLAVEMNRFWADYANTMSTIAVLFGNLDIASEDVLLKEDVDLFGFLPLKDGFHGFRATAEQLSFKEVEDATSRLHPQEETILRVKDLLTDAVALSNKDHIPLVFEEDKFTYSPHASSVLPPAQFDDDDDDDDDDDAQNGVADQSWQMNAMVDSLVLDDPEERLEVSVTDDILEELANAHSRRNSGDAVRQDMAGSSAFSPWDQPAGSAPAGYAFPGPAPYGLPRSSYMPPGQAPAMLPQGSTFDPFQEPAPFRQQDQSRLTDFDRFSPFQPLSGNASPSPDRATNPPPPMFFPPQVRASRLPATTKRTSISPIGKK